MVQKTVIAVITILIICVITFAAYKAVNMPEQRSLGEKIGSTVEDVGESIQEKSKP